MLHLILAQVDPKTAEVAVTHIEKQPWVAVVVVLLGIFGVLLTGLVWVPKKLLPWLEARQAATQAHTEKLVAARGAEAVREMADLSDKLADRLDRVADHVAELRADLAKIGAKIGVALVVLLLLTGLSASSSPAARRGELARAADAPGRPGSGPAHGRPCIPACVRPSVCEDGRCVASSRKPAPPKPGPHSPSSDTELPAWADSSTPDRPGDAMLTACAAESALWGAL